jgi:hypothetical protein
MYLRSGVRASAPAALALDTKCIAGANLTFEPVFAPIYSTDFHFRAILHSADLIVPPNLQLAFAHVHGAFAGLKPKDAILRPGSIFVTRHEATAISRGFTWHHQVGSFSATQDTTGLHLFDANNDIRKGLRALAHECKKNCVTQLAMTRASPAFRNRPEILSSII